MASAACACCHCGVAVTGRYAYSCFRNVACEDPLKTPTTTAERLRRIATQPNVLFGGVYGAVLASSMVAALTQYGETTAHDRLYDAQWVLATAVASALAHGYAHLVAQRTGQSRKTARVVARVMLDEWPLIAATLPTALLLLGAGLRWWPSEGVEYLAFALNTVLLFTWGLVASRAARRPWRTALAVGIVDALLGLAVVGANALIK